MVRITKSERNKLIAMGLKCQGDISRTYNHDSHYYLRESDENLKLLNELRGEKEYERI